MSKLAAALDLAARGFRVFPIKPGAKHPPLLNGWPTKATSDPEVVAMYWLPMPEANIGIHCEGLAVIDVDVNKGGNDALERLRMLYDLPATLCGRTPTGGSHLFYRLPEGHAGVPNSVGHLGEGMDVRSTGGYVVAAGSVVAAGTYEWEHPGVAIADAPGWLVERLGAPRKSAPGDKGAVVDAPDAMLERAREWLQGAERSVKGAGGDQAAFRVAAGLRDLGVSEAQACELMRSEAWDHGCGWREGKLEDKPIRSAYRYASGEPGAKAASPDEFPLIEPVPNSGTIVPKMGTLLQSLTEFANREQASAGYVIKGLLQRASYAETYGAPGEGKTFIALDQSYHVAADQPWMGRNVHAGPVLYLAYEGTGGMVKRAKALRQKYGTQDVPLYIVGAAFNLRESKGRRDLGEMLSMLPAKPVLIVIDTFARALMGGDENSAQDVGAFNSAIAALIESTGACVMIIHHSGKDKSKGARGSSALLGALDTEIEVDGGQVHARKQRDIEIAMPIGFKLVPLVVGIDADGDEVTSCIVDPASVGALGLKRLKGNDERGWRVLCAMNGTNAPVFIEDWKDACRKEFLTGASVTARFSDIKQHLKAYGYINIDDDSKVTRRME